MEAYFAVYLWASSQANKQAIWSTLEQELKRTPKKELNLSGFPLNTRSVRSHLMPWFGKFLPDFMPFT